MATTIQKSGFLRALISPYAATSAQARREYRFDPDLRAWGIPVAIGLFLLAASIVGWFINPQQFYFSYLIAWTFCLSITLGALFFVMIHHLTKARWSVVIRRITETLMWTFPLLALFSIPIFIGMHDLYHWTHHELYDPSAEGWDPILAGKHAYLNVPFFIARVVFYFVMWTILGYRLYTLSLRQDLHPEWDLTLKMRKTSAWGIPVFAVTVAFASYDLLMSLDPHWFSTIFGVYFFAGCFWSVIATMILVSASLQRSGSALRQVVTAEHYHDLGKYLFAFTVFWAYIAFSQYMLIWYGNLPEETVWYRHRLEHGWGYHSAMLLIGHFIIPFVVLLPRVTKRVVPILSFMAVWALVMHWFDLHWLSMPVLDQLQANEAALLLDAGGEAVAENPAGRPAFETHAGFHWLDFTCWLGLTGLYVGLVLYRLGRHPVVPQSDPYLPQSLAFTNT